MNIKIWVLPILLLILVLAGLFWYRRYQQSLPENYQEIGPIDQLVIEGVIFDIEIAVTAQERAKGLSGRSQLCDQCGMLFVFPQEDYHSFWMKDTLIPLDIVWLDKNWRVVDYLVWAQPQGVRKLTDLPTYQPKKPAQFVIEFPGGTVKRIRNFNIGSQITTKQQN
ncbi:MAG: DUF192 domain-containing protein [Candidatus Shapirobacteria bacterium]|nr:DUF192 domain-containing protein [Candidatus Shapirobacteria bacterium]